MLGGDAAGFAGRPDGAVPGPGQGPEGMLCGEGIEESQVGQRDAQGVFRFFAELHQAGHVEEQDFIVQQRGGQEQPGFGAADPERIGL